MIGKNSVQCNLEDSSLHNYFDFIINFNSLSKEEIYNKLSSEGYCKREYRLDYLSEYKNDTENNLNNVSGSLDFFTEITFYNRIINMVNTSLYNTDCISLHMFDDKYMSEDMDILFIDYKFGEDENEIYFC